MSWSWRLLVLNSTLSLLRGRHPYRMLAVPKNGEEHDSGAVHRNEDVQGDEMDTVQDHVQAVARQDVACRAVVLQVVVRDELAVVQGEEVERFTLRASAAACGLTRRGARLRLALVWVWLLLSERRLRSRDEEDLERLRRLLLSWPLAAEAAAGVSGAVEGRGRGGG